jgi:protein-S-isoprenylcysteine O-methyltransferase Ste14
MGTRGTVPDNLNQCRRVLPSLLYFVRIFIVLLHLKCCEESQRFYKMKSKIAETLIASLGTLLFLLLIIPFFLIWIPHRILLSPEYIYRFEIGIYRYFGLAPIVLGVVIYLFCSGSFVFVGKGTPIPFTPTKELIVTGLFRFVRNPLYIAGVLILILKMKD